MSIEAKITAHEKGAQKGFGEIIINGEFVVEGIKVMEGPNGLFVAMPSYKKNNGTYQEVFSPTTKEAREELRAAVMESYHNSLERNREPQVQNETQEKNPEREPELETPAKSNSKKVPDVSKENKQSKATPSKAKRAR